MGVSLTPATGNQSSSGDSGTPDPVQVVLEKALAG